jgi:GDP-L-fucose synthase
MHEAKANGGQAVVWGTGTPRREFLYSDDAADACILLLNLSEERFTDLVGGVEEPPLVNVGWGEDMTVRDVAELVAEVVGLNQALIFDPTKPDGTPRKLMNTSRLTSHGWKPRTSLREGLQETYKDFCAHLAETRSALEVGI